jgi:prephenate dehydratase
MGDGEVRGARGDDECGSPPRRRRSPTDDRGSDDRPDIGRKRSGGVDLESGDDLGVIGAGEQDRPAAVSEQLGDDRCALVWRFSGCVDRFGETLAERPVVVDPSKTEIGEREARKACGCRVDPDRAVTDGREELVEIEIVHTAHYPARMIPGTPPPRRISYLGPAGTFSEEALLTQPDLGRSELVSVTTIQDAILACASGTVDAAFVPLENMIEGSINVTLDQLIFDVDLLIEREVVLNVHLDALVRSGTVASGVRRVLSFPAATAQCRGYLRRVFPNAEVVATNSTADAARLVALDPGHDVVAISPPLSAKVYGLEVFDHAIEDHDGNVTRFVLVGTGPSPARTGDDRTTIVCFQRSDRPGSLAEILARFAARNINLTRIESRPTKQALGEYCFAIEFSGHITDEVVGDCLRELHMATGDLKFLGSYPVAGGAPSARTADVESERMVADAWLSAQRRRVAG